MPFKNLPVPVHVLQKSDTNILNRWYHLLGFQIGDISPNRKKIIITLYYCIQIGNITYYIQIPVGDINYFNSVWNTNCSQDFIFICSNVGIIHEGLVNNLQKYTLFIFIIVCLSLFIAHISAIYKCSRDSCFTYEKSYTVTASILYFAAWTLFKCRQHFTRQTTINGR